jgi:hypothetical protein
MMAEGGAGVEEYVAVLKTFAVDDTGVPTSLLADHINRHPRDLAAIAPGKFEELVADVYSELFACRVEHCSYGRPDKGIDVVALRRDNGHEIAFQVKRHKRPITLSLIHSFFGALFDGGYNRGIFVTSGRYQRGCRLVTAGLNAKSSIQIELIDGKQFLDFLQAYGNQKSGRVLCPPWDEYRPLIIPDDYDFTTSPIVWR